MSIRTEEFHPMVVHFPIALLAVGVLFALAGSLLKRESFKSMALLLIGLGTLGAAAAVVTGLMAEETFPHRSFQDLHEAVELHELLGFITLGMSVVLTVGWVLARMLKGVRLAPLMHVLGLATVGVLAATGYYGGHLTYDHAAGVYQDGESVIMQKVLEEPAIQPGRHDD